MSSVAVAPRARKNFSRLKHVLDLPDLIDIQKASFDWFLKDGLRENPSWIAFALEDATVYHTYTVSAPDPFVAPYFSFLEERTPKPGPAEDAPFPDPARLFVTPDHYIFRMLYSQGVTLEEMGIPRKDGGAVETDARKIWRN